MGFAVHGAGAEDAAGRPAARDPAGKGPPARATTLVTTVTDRMTRIGGLHPTVGRRYLARAASIASLSSFDSGVTLLGKNAITLPSLPTRYLQKFQLGRFPPLPR